MAKLMAEASERHRQGKPIGTAAQIAQERYDEACDDEVTDAVLRVATREELAHGRKESIDDTMHALETLKKMDAKVKNNNDRGLIRKHDHHWGHLELAKQPAGEPCKLPDAREQCASVYCGSSLFLFGGIAAGRTNRLWEMCTTRLEWRERVTTGARPTARASATMTAVEIDEDAPPQPSSSQSAGCGGGSGGDGDGGGPASSGAAAGEGMGFRSSSHSSGGGAGRKKEKKEKPSAFVHKRYIYLFGGECSPPSAAEIEKERALDTHDHSHDDEKKAASPKRATASDRVKVLETGQRRDAGDMYRLDLSTNEWEAMMVTSGRDEFGRMLPVPSARRGHTATLVPGPPPTRDALRGLIPPGPLEADNRRSVAKEKAVTTGSIWLYGGMGPDKARGEQSTFDELFVLSLRSGQWCPAALSGSKLPPRALHTATLVRHRIIVIGGLDGKKPQSLYPDGKDFAAGASVAGRRTSRASRGSVGPNGERKAKRRMSRFAESKALETEWLEENAPKIIAIDTAGLFAARVRLPYEEVAPPFPPSTIQLPWPSGSPVWVYGAQAVVSPQAPDEIFVFGGRPAIPGRQPSNQIWTLRIDPNLCQDGLGRGARKRLLPPEETAHEPDEDLAAAGVAVGPDTGTGNFWRPLAVAGHAPHARCHHVMQAIPATSNGRDGSSDLVLLYGGVNLPATGYMFRGPKALEESVNASMGIGNADARAHPTASGYECDSGQANSQIFVMHMREMSGSGRDPNFDHDKAERSWLKKMASGASEASALEANLKKALHKGGDEPYASMLPSVVVVAPASVRPHTAAGSGGAAGVFASPPFSNSSASILSPQLSSRDEELLALRAAKADSTSRKGERCLSKSKTAERYHHNQKKAAIDRELHTTKQKSALREKLMKRKLQAQVKVQNGEAAEAREAEQRARAKRDELEQAKLVAAAAADHHAAGESMSYKEDAAAAVSLLRGKSFDNGYSEWKSKTWQPIHAQYVCQPVPCDHSRFISFALLRRLLLTSAPTCPPAHNTFASHTQLFADVFQGPARSPVQARAGICQKGARGDACRGARDGTEPPWRWRP